MQIRVSSKFRYRIIDFINEQPWQLMAVSSTMLALTMLWVIGLLAIIVSR